MNSLNFMQSKQTKKLTITLMEQNKKFVSCICSKGLIFKIYKDLMYLNAKTKHSNSYVSPNKLRYILKTALT